MPINPAILSYMVCLRDFFDNVILKMPELSNGRPKPHKARVKNKLFSTMQVGCALGIYLCIQKGPRAAYFDIFFAY